MKNLLPSITPKLGRLDDDTKLSRTWKLEDSNPFNPNSISSILRNEITSIERKRENDVLKKLTLISSEEKEKEQKRKIHPPNYIDPMDLLQLGESPLNEKNRGEKPQDMISMPPPSLMKRNTMVTLLPSINFSEDQKRKKILSRLVIVHLFNLMPYPFDAFFQNNGKIRTYMMQPSTEIIKELNPAPKDAKIDVNSNFDCLGILVTSADKALTMLSTSEEVKTVEFRTDIPIGMEIEFINNKLIITGIKEGTQAGLIKDINFIDAAIYGVNNKRVLDMDEFNQTLIDSKKFSQVSLTLSLWKDSNPRPREIVQVNSWQSAKNKQVKQMISNIFLNKNYFNKQNDSDSEEENENHNDANRPKVIENEIDKIKKSIKKTQNVNPFLHYSDDEDDESTVNTSNLKDSEDELDKSQGEVSEAEVKSQVSLEVSKNQNLEDNVLFNIPDSQCEDEDIENLLAPKRVLKQEATIVHSIPDPEPETKESPKYKFDEESKEEIKEFNEESKEEYEEGSKEVDPNSNDEDDEDDYDDWNKMTKFEESLPFIALVCVPPLFSRSSGWGLPKNSFYIVNYSRNWKLEIFYVDNEGLLLPRGEIKRGEDHLELCNSTHVWACLVTNLSENSRRLNEKSINMDSSDTYDVNSTFSKNQSMLVIKPSAASLVDGKCNTILWSPFCSISFSQTFSNSSSKVNVPSNSRAIRLSNHIKSSTQTTSPNIFLQLFDSNIPNLPQPPSLNSSTLDLPLKTPETYYPIPRKTLRSTRSLNQMRRDSTKNK